MVVGIDEIHYASNSETRRTKATRLLAGRGRRVVSLSGTPVERDPIAAYKMLTSAKARPFDYETFCYCFNAHEKPYGGLEYERHPSPPGSTAPFHLRPDKAAQYEGPAASDRDTRVKIPRPAPKACTATSSLIHSNQGTEFKSVPCFSQFWMPR